MSIDIEDLHIAYAGRTVIAGAHLLATEGEITGLVGRNGSGKSTLLRTVYRHLKPATGRVPQSGIDLRRLSAAEAARHVAALPQERGGDFELMERHTGRRFTELSGGERQRVLPARASAQQPDVLALDEHTNHLDIRHQVELLALLRALRRTPLVSLHDLNAAASVCDRPHVLHDGQVVASRPPRELLQPALSAEVFGVRATVADHPLAGAPLIAFAHRPPPTAHRPPSAGRRPGRAGRARRASGHGRAGGAGQYGYPYVGPERCLGGWSRASHR
ncbi:ABC transporter ATP-binding protein [Streptomyces sp. DT2A-34]|uniref:ABC transporter ATP-binding protein n=1 Tax=Streptomyces sp. DT2A-34 TaxID=3051182 RepID=UPI00265C817D|nr:ABC transporter ATP-binding protein [Streptomyces sp. DT2A-34]MDO0917045.1 ABC transporter ATP-binding protein [Streptomyces sp. DT2A-34]